MVYFKDNNHLSKYSYNIFGIPLSISKYFFL